MIRASIIIGSIVGALLFFAWNMTQRNYNLIREEIKSATEGIQCGRGE